jgi:hypothetical protein
LNQSFQCVLWSTFQPECRQRVTSKVASSCLNLKCYRICQYLRCRHRLALQYIPSKDLKVWFFGNQSVFNPGTRRSPGCFPKKGAGREYERVCDLGNLHMQVVSRDLPRGSRHLAHSRATGSNAPHEGRTGESSASICANLFPAEIVLPAWIL